MRNPLTIKEKVLVLPRVFFSNGETAIPLAYFPLFKKDKAVKMTDHSIWEFLITWAKIGSKEIKKKPRINLGCLLSGGEAGI